MNRSACPCFAWISLEFNWSKMRENKEDLCAKSPEAEVIQWLPFTGKGTDQLSRLELHPFTGEERKSREVFLEVLFSPQLCEPATRQFVVFVFGFGVSCVVHFGLTLSGLYWNSQSSCLSLQVLGFTGLCYCIWLQCRCRFHSVVGFLVLFCECRFCFFIVFFKCIVDCWRSFSCSLSLLAGVGSPP